MKLLLPTLALLLLCGCNTQQRELLAHTETVLGSGMTLTGTNEFGTVTITAGEGTKRTYEGSDWKKERNLIARQTRWNGSLGLYDPASSLSPDGRLILNEGRKHFDSADDFLRHLYSGSAVKRPVYTNDGLVFEYSHTSRTENSEPTRSVSIWQIYINGKKPKSLPHADDSAISLQGGDTPETSDPHDAPVGYEMLYGKKPYEPNKVEPTGTGQPM